MKQVCKKGMNIGGAFVEACSADGTGKPVCTLGSRTDIRHVVTVENLRLYPADIDCCGLISAVPYKVKFDPQGSVTAVRWDASVTNLSDDYTFDQATLLANTNQGTEVIRAEVTVRWSQPGTDASGAVDIKVSA